MGSTSSKTIVRTLRSLRTRRIPLGALVFGSNCRVPISQQNSQPVLISKNVTRPIPHPSKTSGHSQYPQGRAAATKLYSRRQERRRTPYDRKPPTRQSIAPEPTRSREGRVSRGRETTRNDSSADEQSTAEARPEPKLATGFPSQNNKPTMLANTSTSQTKSSSVQSKTVPGQTQSRPVLSFSIHGQPQPHYQPTNFGKTGLDNLGNTCYMNAVIQCLSATLFVRRYELIGDLESVRDTELGRAFAKLVKCLWNGLPTTNSRGPLLKFKQYVDWDMPQFKDSSKQHDCHEFLMGLFAGLRKGPFNEIIEKYLFGTLQDVLTCAEGHSRVSTESFTTLFIDTRNIRLEYCLDRYLQGDYLYGGNAPNCERCQRKCPATKTRRFSLLPDVLLIHLNRFSSEGGDRKNKFGVRSPLTFSLRQFRPNRDPEIINYELHAVINHHGETSTEGHYTAYVRNDVRKAQEWYMLDDSKSTVISKSVVYASSEDAYLLWYMRH